MNCLGSEEVTMKFKVTECHGDDLQCTLKGRLSGIILLLTMLIETKKVRKMGWMDSVPACHHGEGHTWVRSGLEFIRITYPIK